MWSLEVLSIILCVCMIVSPLNALMVDQVTKLKSKGMMATHVFSDTQVNEKGHSTERISVCLFESYMLKCVGAMIFELHSVARLSEIKWH